MDLAPTYAAPRYIVPAAWHGSGPFVEAHPSDAALRKDWWRLFNDPVLDELEAQALGANPDLQAAAERFVQARDEMMKQRSKLVPKLGAEIGGGGELESLHKPFRPDNVPRFDSGMNLGGLASWEPDFWSAIRNATRAQIYRAERRAAEYGLARLSLQSELAAQYFTLRGLDAQAAIYRQSIAYYESSLALVNEQFQGKIASSLDVARAEYQLSSTQTRLLAIIGQRQVTEHALAALVNRVPAGFTVAPVDALEIVEFRLPAQVPSTLLERRPDIAAMEREMAQANREIGIARAAFYPNVSFSLSGGVEGAVASLFHLASAFWSYGAMGEVPAFQGGYRRAQLQQSWSRYRETQDLYRNTVLRAFQEVEDGLSLTYYLSQEVARQGSAIAAAFKQQEVSMQLYRGGLSSSLDLISSQVNTLESRIKGVEIKADLLKSVVGLIRALGGGWNRADLPSDDTIQPFGVVQYSSLDKPDAVNGVDVSLDTKAHDDLTKPTGKPEAK